MIRRLALAALLLASATAAAGPRFDLPPALPQDDRAATLDLLDAAVARLPPAWAAALDRPVAVEWRSDLPAGVHGRARHWRILLDRALLEGWKRRTRGAADAAAFDDAAVDAAMAAVIHELAHLYDRTPAGGLSRDPRLLDLAGWQVAALRPGRRARNDFHDRSPDAYELHSPREYVAVNLEHYLLDPAYACRRPALARHFDAHFGTSPVAAADAPACADGVAFVQDAIDGQDPLRTLNPARIYQVDYLLAEANARPMSRWGHSMLRLVVCAPGRAPGPDCRLDLQYHLVLSFRAFVDDLQISSWRGLTGAYPSRLFALPLGQVVDEYTRAELRGLRSVPLALSQAEVQALAARAAQLHWNYDGRYFFVSNNCAVETWKLLHDALPRLAALPLSAITPTGLLRRLQAHGITDAAAVPADPDEQVRQGYYFESAHTHHEAMYTVARDELGLAPADAAAWLALEPQVRTPHLERAGLRSAAALLVLESAALRQQQALARDALKRRGLGRRYGDADGNGNNGGNGNGMADAVVAAELDEFLRLGGAFSRPASWLEGVAGYGLPQQAERESVRRRALADAGARRDNAVSLEQRLKALLPPARRQALADSEANVALVGQRLREHAGAP